MWRKISLIVFCLGILTINCTSKHEPVPTVPISSPKPRNPLGILCDSNASIVQRKMFLKKLALFKERELLDQVINNDISECNLEYEIRREAVSVVLAYISATTEKAQFLRGLFLHPDPQIRKYADNFYEQIAHRNISRGEKYVLLNFPGTDVAKRLINNTAHSKFVAAKRDNLFILRAVYLKDQSILYDRPLHNITMKDCPKCKCISVEDSIFWVLLDYNEEWVPLIYNFENYKIVWTKQDNLNPTYESLTEFKVADIISLNTIFLENFGVIRLIGVPSEDIREHGYISLLHSHVEEFGKFPLGFVPNRYKAPPGVRLF